MPESSFTPQQKIDYRTRIYNHNEIIDTRIGLIYEVKSGGVIIVNPNRYPKESDKSQSLVALIEPGEVFELFFDNEIALPLDDYTKITWHNENHLVELRKLGTYNKALQNQLKFQRALNYIKGGRRNKYKIFELLTLLNNYHPSLSKLGEVPSNPTHGKIAETLGITRVTVTRLFKKLRAEMLVTTKEDNLNFLTHPDII
jgi:Bacterial regulatory proteins, crp family